MDAVGKFIGGIFGSGIRVDQRAAHLGRHPALNWRDLAADHRVVDIPVAVVGRRGSRQDNRRMRGQIAVDLYKLAQLLLILVAMGVPRRVLRVVSAQHNGHHIRSKRLTVCKRIGFCIATVVRTVLEQGFAGVTEVLHRVMRTKPLLQLADIVVRSGGRAAAGGDAVTHARDFYLDWLGGADNLHIA